LELGLCSIGWTLVRWNPELRNEERAFQQALDSAEKQNWPRPHIVSIKARADVAATQWNDDDAYTLNDKEQSSYTLRGSHILEGISPDQLRQLCRQELPNPDTLADLSIADYFCALNLARESQLKVKELCGDMTPATRGQQRQVLEALLAWCRDEAKGLDRAVLEGPAGVGKSRVLARLTRYLLVDYLSRCGSRGARPTVYMNLRDVVLTQPIAPDTDGSAMLQAVLGGWAQACANAPGLPRRFLERLTHTCKGHTYVLVQDSVDDFLGRNPSVRLDALQRMWNAMQIAPIAGARRVAVGVRSGQPILMRFQTVWTKFSLDLLAASEAARLLPALAKRINQPPSNKDELYDAIQCLRTPLVAFALSRRPEEVQQLANAMEAGNHRTATILQMALRAIVISTLPDHAPLTPDTAMDALSWLGRISYFKPQRPGPNAGDNLAPRSMTQKEMEDGALSIAAIWRPITATDPPLEARIQAAEKAIRDPQSRTLLLQTVFQSLSEDCWEFTHARWRDLLVASYYKQCVLHEQLESFGGIAYVPKITGLTGQLIGPWYVPAKLVRDAADRSLQEMDCLYVSNVMAVTAWNPHAVLAGEAWNEALNTFCDTRQADFARCLILNVVVIRWLINAGVNDGGALPEAAAGQRAQLIETLTQCATQENPRVELPAHLALSYLHLIGGNEGAPESPGPVHFHDAPNDPESFFRRVYGIPKAEATSHSLQHSLIQLVDLLPAQSRVRGVATVHYVVMLVLFFRTGRWIEDTSIKLDEVFKDGSYHDRFYRGDLDNHGLPETASHMFAWAREYWRNSAGRS
jgi:hypothetical protein